MSFIAPLLIILSLVGIVVIVLRKTPEVTRLRMKFARKEPASKKQAAGRVWAGAVQLMGLLWRGLGVLFGKLWAFILTAKELSKKTNFGKLPKTFSALSIKKPKLSFFTSPDSAEFYVQKAEESVDRGELEQAEQQYIKAIEKDPGLEKAYAGLGKLYLFEKKFTDARETYEYLVKHHPENDGYYSSLGQSLHNLKKYRQAVSAYKQAIKLEPEEPRRYINLGLTFEAMDKFGEAVEAYKKAVAFDGENSQFLMALAESYIKQDETESAQEILERVLRFEPTNHIAREKLMKLKF